MTDLCNQYKEYTRTLILMMNEYNNFERTNIDFNLTFHKLYNIFEYINCNCIDFIKDYPKLKSQIKIKIQYVKNILKSCKIDNHFSEEILNLLNELDIKLK
jgi:hypothetical protein